MGDSVILTAALGYAARGWPVFPCHPGTKAPLTKRGLKEASADVARIRTWWARWPDAMIGLPLGGPTGLFALDFDPREESDPQTGEIVQFTYRQLREETEALLGRELPATAASRTPSGGFHVFYRQPDGTELGNRKGSLPRHVDVRGLGGYVIAPPSVRADGRAYQWVEGRDPDGCAPVEAPAELVALLRGDPGMGAGAGGSERPRNIEGGAPSAFDLADEAVRKYGLAALDRERDQLARTGSGGRNQALNNAALALGSLVAAGALSEAMARAALQEAAQANGLWADDGPRACLATIDSGMKAGLRSPRDLSEVRAEAERRAGRAGNSRPRQDSVGSPRGRGLAPARGSAQPAASAEGSAAPSAPPAPPFGDVEYRPSHVGGKRRRRGKKWGPGAAWDWVWVWELVAAVRDLQRCAMLPETDLGNAERWAIAHGNGFRYSEELGWLAWDGMRWKREGGDPKSYPPMLGRSAIAVVRAIQREAAFIAGTGCPDALAAALAGVRHDPEGRDLVLKWVGPKDDKVPILRSMQRAKFGRDCEASGRIGAIASLARLQPGVAVSSQLFDREPMLFNVANGTLEFRRPSEPGGKAEVVLRPHDPADMLTKVSPVVYDPAAAAPQYDAFFERVQTKPEMRRFLHAWAGYSLTGDVNEQCFVILHGTEGGNGKSTWELIRAHVMGDYAQKVNVETFLDGNFEKSGAQASPDIARLPGARMVYTSEPKQGKRFAEDLIKVVTGSESVTARHLNRDFFEFLPEFKISVACNRPPEASDDKAFWRRVRLTPWEVSVPEKERDKGLPRKLQAEASGILNHFIAGALDWLEAGLPVPDAVTQATKRYQDESDPLGRFLTMAVEVDRGSRVQSSHLYRIFQAWCAFTGEKEWTQTLFSKKLTLKGFKKIQSSNMYWEQLRPVFEAEAFGLEQFDGMGKPTGWRGRDEIDLTKAADSLRYVDPTVQQAASAAADDGAEMPAPPAPPSQEEWDNEPDW